MTNTKNQDHKITEPYTPMHHDRVDLSAAPRGGRRAAASTCRSRSLSAGLPYVQKAHKAVEELRSTWCPGVGERASRDGSSSAPRYDCLGM